MDNDLKKIIEIEQACEEKIAAAEQIGRERLAGLEKELAENKKQLISELQQKNRRRMTRRINRTHSEIQEQLNQIRDRNKDLMQDRDLCRTIKNRLIEAILETGHDNEFPEGQPG